MIKKWNQFNESMAEKPGPNVPGSVKITMSTEEASSFSDEPVLSKLIYDDKISLLGNDIWYLESDAQTKGILDTYLEMSGENKLEEVTESNLNKKFENVEDEFDMASSHLDDESIEYYKNEKEKIKRVMEQFLDDISSELDDFTTAVSGDFRINDTLDTFGGKYEYEINIKRIS